MSERQTRPEIKLQSADASNPPSAPDLRVIERAADELQGAVNGFDATRWCNAFVSQPRFRDGSLPVNELYGPDPYDVNFCFPYLPQSLQTDTIAIVPFIPRLHAEKLFLHARQHPKDLQYMNIPVPRTLESMLTWIEFSYRRDPSKMAYTVLCADSVGRWSVCGIISLVGCNPLSMTAEIAMGLTYHESRGRSRAKATVSLLLCYCFNTPADKIPGLGLRKVGWTAHSKNHLAQVIPLALGFRVESMLRWNRVATEGKVGNGRVLREGDPLRHPGIDDFYLVMCWDDWEMERRRSAEASLGKREAKL